MIHKTSETHTPFELQIEAELPHPDEFRTKPAWSYEEAFSRNLGLISKEEQQKLRNSRVAIAGMGGVGGIHLATLARLGIGKFTIADPDTFELANMNRQYGASQSTIGRSKVEVMEQIARDINPDVEIKVFREPISSNNAEAFLDNADVLVDAIDAFTIDIRRLLFRMAAEKGIYGLGAGPVGFSAVWVIFDPNGLEYDRYFDFSDKMDQTQKFIAYIVGMAPKATQRGYLDASYVNLETQSGPSVSCACQLAAGTLAAETIKILLGRGRIKAAPHYFQFDPFVGRFIQGRLIGGNRNPIQQLKRWWLTRYLRSRNNQP